MEKENDLNISNILLEDEINTLFEKPDENNDEVSNGEKVVTETTEEKQKTTEVNTENLFSARPESVSSDQNNQEEGESTESDEADSSPKSTGFYSSIAAALKDEGILPDLDEDTIKGIETPEAFSEAINKQIQSRFDEKQKRIDEALSLGMEPSEIKQFENTLSYLDTITEDSLESEDDNGEMLRKQLIFQDFINRGFSKERANKEVEKSFTAGTDLDDAKESLKSNKDYFVSLYKQKIKEKEEADKQLAKEKNKELAALKKQVLDTEEPFAGIKLDKATREKVYNTITKPVYKDDDGMYYTELQKYEKENKHAFLHNLGIIYTLTNGFKNLDALVKGEVNKKTSTKLRELSHVLNNTSRNTDGSLKFVSSVSEDENANINFELDI